MALADVPDIRSTETPAIGPTLARPLAAQCHPPYAAQQYWQPYSL